MTYLLSRTFWLGALERATKTFCQTLIATLGLATGLNMVSINWREGLCVAGLATLISVLTSVASGPIGPPNTPGVVMSRARQPLP